MLSHDRRRLRAFPAVTLALLLMAPRFAAAQSTTQLWGNISDGTRSRDGRLTSEQIVNFQVKRVW